MINGQRGARGLWDMITDQRPVADRATLLPIGQYDDGSLTLAWPQFLVDAAEGAQRSYLDAAGISAPDTAGGKWSSNVDALNAASVGPMGGVVGRMAGAIPRNSTGVATTDLRPMPSAPAHKVRVPGTHYTTADFDRFDAAALGGGGDAFGRGVYSTPMEWVASQEARTPGRGFSYGSRFEDGARNIPTEHVLQRPFEMDKFSTPDGRSDWSALRRNWLGPKWRYDMAPWEAAEAGRFGGVRGDAAKAFNDALRAHGFDGVTVYNGGLMEEVMSFNPGSVTNRLTGDTLFANPDTAALPAIFGHPQEQPVNGLLASHYDERTTPKPPPKYRMWPAPDPFAPFFQNIPRDTLPPGLRPPLDVPDRAPEFYEDNWLRRVTGMDRPGG